VLGFRRVSGYESIGYLEDIVESRGFLEAAHVQRHARLICLLRIA
jgi:hypothetical protein